MAGASRGPNLVLKRVLAEIGWSPYDLARAVNRAMEQDNYIHRTTPTLWCDKGVVPHPPLPSVVAGILTEAYGEPISVAELWQGRAKSSPLYLPTTAGLDEDWSQAGTLKLLVELRRSVVERRQFFAVAGAALAAPAHAWEQTQPDDLVAVLKPGERVTPNLMSHIEADIARLRRLDDGQGGALVLKMARAGLDLVVDFLHNSTYSEAVGKRLYSAAAELAQLAGWISFDLGDHARAQRYYLIALRAAHTADDRALGALVLSCIAFQQTWRGRPQDALALLQSAQRGAAGRATPRVMALLAMREARTRAALRDGASCSAAISRAQDLLSRGGRDSDPAWVYWVDQRVLLNEEGRCRVQLHEPEQAEQHLRRGLALLDDPHCRDRIMYGLCLAEAHLQQDDLEQSCFEARQVLPLLGQIDSSRCRQLVQTMRDKISLHAGIPFVDEFLEEADAHLAA